MDLGILEAVYLIGLILNRLSYNSIEFSLDSYLNLELNMSAFIFLR